MGFFEDSYISAKSLFDTTVKKAGDTIEVQRIKIEIARLNSSVTNDFAALGELCYNEVKGEEKSETAVNSIVDAIDSKKLQIIEQQKKLDEARHNKTCAKCGKINQQNANFCSGCGAEL